MLEGVVELGENEVKFEATKGDVVKKQVALLMTSEGSKDIELSLKERCRFASNVVFLSVCCWSVVAMSGDVRWTRLYRASSSPSSSSSSSSSNANRRITYHW